MVLLPVRLPVLLDDTLPDILEEVLPTDETGDVDAITEELELDVDVLWFDEATDDEDVEAWLDDADKLLLELETRLRLLLLTEADGEDDGEDDGEGDDDDPFFVTELTVDCDEVVVAEVAVLLGLETLLELDTDDDVIGVFDVDAVAVEAVVLVEPAIELDSVAEAELVEAAELNIEAVEVDDAEADVVALPVLAEEVEEEANSVDDNDVVVLDVVKLFPVIVLELSCRDELETDDDALRVLDDDDGALEALEPVEFATELEGVIEMDEDTVEMVEVDDDAETDAVVLVGVIDEVEAEVKSDDDAVLDEVKILVVIVLELKDNVSGVLELEFEEDDEAVDARDDVDDCSLLTLAALVLLLYDKDDCVLLETRLLSLSLLDVELAVKEMLTELVETVLAVIEVLVGDVLAVDPLDTVSVVLIEELLLLGEVVGSGLLTVEVVVKLDIVDVALEPIELVESFSGLDVFETALLVEVDSEVCSVEAIVDETKLSDELPPVEMVELVSDVVVVVESTSEVLDKRLEEDEEVSMSELGIEVEGSNEFVVLDEAASVTDDVDAKDSDVDDDGKDVTASEEDELEEV
ncbi:hypothetical protein PGQ11_006402 [Apiospora arundinis]|uniref:Uncharacterized protein n=1 Tax=Apiospora arundinis TaxID=335852 RepID=A0ABR2ISK5_9PEZI